MANNEHPDVSTEFPVDPDGREALNIEMPAARVFKHSHFALAASLMLLCWGTSVDAADHRDRSQVRESDREWWAFRPLSNPEPPELKTAKRGGNPIDAFLMQRLEQQKLSLNPSADRRTLIRRASFDLRGLPPAPEEVEAFVNDRKPGAWLRVIRSFLDSPRYGERWARHWLDVARFAESSGFEHDYDRPNAYHYRDFVIKALNEDMPYDRFVRWQIAGDEFEPDNPLALMATGFLGAGVFPTQITANEVERTRYDALDDMLSTTGSAMLGLTVGCARCHDHKFDAIPSNDYYRMLSSFTTTVRSDIELDLHPEENRKAKEAFEREHAPLITELRRYEAQDLPRNFDAWLATGAPVKSGTDWELLEATDLRSKAGATFKRLEDGSYLAEGKNGDSDTYTFTAQTSLRELRALRVEAMAHSSMPKGGPGRADNGNIGLSKLRLFAAATNGGPTNELKLARARATFEQNGAHLSVASALDTDPRTGWAVDPQFGTNHAAIFELEQPAQFPETMRLVVQLEFALNSRHNIGRPRLSITGVEAAPLGGETITPQIAAVLEKAQARKPIPAPERTELIAWWRVSDPGWRKAQAQVLAHQKQAPKPKLTKVLICGEGYPALRMHTQGADFLPETHFLQRGSTDLKRGVATQGFLQVLLRGTDPSPEHLWRSEPPAQAKYSGRRRALATWMTDPDRGAGHLLARVMVNRLWQHHFGQGLVVTPNDFGVQGAKPSHPELLDWLAAELIRGGWRLKPIHQLLMTSDAYQQSSLLDEHKRQVDPANTLFSRRVPERLQGEAIRDSLLWVSGALDTNMFGPGTLDENSRRRSIYFTIKRSQLVPSMTAFDAPEPLVSQGTRPTTTVAPQALWLMNSPAVRGWASLFGQRVKGAKPMSHSERVAKAYSLALNRRPTRQETLESVRFIETQLTRYRSENKSDAEDLALTDFAQVVLNLNEFVYVE
ncbi:MAG: DUF1549 domain-containing protein [Verrucomicrobiales bacterium]|nr:DUF1549 domain-containing protein [Verrucomicrobiales bacterium]